MPRLVRQRPLGERIKSWIDPEDWHIWISDKLDSEDWEDFAKEHSRILGFAMNLVFIIAQANASRSSESDDDVLLGGNGGPGWFAWFCRLLILGLSSLSFLNAFFTFYRKRHYRLFEQPIESDPATPSAQRVRVDSSPATGSPLYYLRNMIGSASAGSRAHPDAARDVWEIAVWNPNPLCLDIFCLFNPLHVILYYLTLPVAPLDPQPSVKVFTTVVIGTILSFQFWFFRSSFSQQIRDNDIIRREVLHEYDSKFVHPNTQKVCRDVGIQTISRNTTRDSSVGVRGSSDGLASEVVTYTPTTILNRTFKTNPNQSYASQYDPDNVRHAQTPSRHRAPSTSTYTSTTTGTGADFSSPIRPSNTPNPFRQQPTFRPTTTGDGGSLGVYSHANSPLRKAASTNFIRDDRGRESLGGAGERIQGTPVRRDGSPLKRMSMSGAAVSGSERLNGALERFGRNAGASGRRESGRF
ncbi:hypothetical protein DM02DRAFT_619159 [Periconia macrospinosa]|uniref:Nuclear rim protein 1 n=1 Tax=Periconia macrospinosa TaxID=97972 RepID=A0A2V1D6E4_9PLEO|nr:hypothetical protein DM02DRAFT_619159 [Periconia macrospinosa]